MGSRFLPNLPLLPHKAAGGVATVAVADRRRTMDCKTETLSIIVVGASGDLAKRKILPALFAIFCQGFLPDSVRIFGFARTQMSDEAFRERIAENLTCRYAPGESCAERVAAFLDRCHYVAGQYDATDSFLDLFQRMHELECSPHTNRMFYLAIPPSVFLDVARAIGDAGLVQCGQAEPWSRVVIEKPFGRDRQSSDTLTAELGSVFREEDVYRIDHYLGKEVIQNLIVLRFANLVFEPLWNREHIESVRIAWKEDLDVAGRGGYFDDYGIIRDVVQNHLLQILALVAMEPPRRLDGDSIRDEKVRVLRQVPPVALNQLVVGQYGEATLGSRHYPAYTADPTVPDNSLTPTYAATVLRIENERWRGVPFFVSAGKGLDDRLTEIRVRFKRVPDSMFCALGSCPAANELVIRVQPDESISLGITGKAPGLGLELHPTTLDLQYKQAFTERIIPDAYESLLVDVMRGEKGLFIRRDELAAAWDIFTPVLHELDDSAQRPEPYPFGSRGPRAAATLAGG